MTDKMARNDGGISSLFAVVDDHLPVQHSTSDPHSLPRFSLFYRGLAEGATEQNKKFQSTPVKSGNSHMATERWHAEQ